MVTNQLGMSWLGSTWYGFLLYVFLFELLLSLFLISSSHMSRKIISLYPVDTGRKLNVHKTFRRRPGRLLNVLCTFNLPPVSTGWSTQRLRLVETYFHVETGQLLSIADRLNDFNMVQCGI